MPQLGSTQGVQAGMVMSLLAVPLRAVCDSHGIKCDRDGCGDILWGLWGCPGTAQQGHFPLPPTEGGRNTTLWGGALHFGWKQEKIHRLGGFESCLDRTASVLLFCDCIAPPERLLRPNCTLQSTVLTVGTQYNKYISFQVLRGGYRKILMWRDCWESQETP